MSHTNHHHHHPTTTALFLAAALLLPGCSNDRRQAMTAQVPGAEGGPTEQVEEPQTTTPQNQQRATDEDRTQLYADLQLLATCGMEAPTVYFEYDSANVRRAAEVELTGLAECLQRPPLADRTIEVIGHADDQGTEPYNEGLGMRRANAVVDELVTAGLDRNRVNARSMGERQADAPDDWDDRRVVIRLVDEAQPPTEASPGETSTQEQATGQKGQKSQKSKKK